MKEKNKIDVELLRRLITYDPKTGVCTWKARPVESFVHVTEYRRWHTRYCGKPCGRIQRAASGKSYIRICLKGFGSPLIHCCIWAIVTGVWADVVDHLDGDGTNNKWKNLRATSCAGNSKNLRRYKNRKHPTGIEPRNGKFRVRIRVDGVLRHVGTFPTMREAKLARKAEERKHGFHPNHGKVRPL